jgi:FG-GAP-like repeat
MSINRTRVALIGTLALTGMPLAWLSTGDAGSGRPARSAHVEADSFPTFARVLLLESTSETSANVSAGDVNGDGFLDLVLAKGRHWPLVSRVLLGDGAGHFPTAYDLSATADRSYSGRLVDLDGDGDLDVVISNDAPDPKPVYLNDGTGHFHLGSTYGRPEWPTRNATTADLDGDGNPDIVAANRGDSTGANYICFNRGGGRFDANCVAFSHEPATTITAGDFNQDGMVDLAVPHRDGGQSRVYLAGPKGTFSPTRTIAFGPPDATIRMAEAADLNGDGLLDLVAIDDEHHSTRIYLARRDGTFSSGTAVGGSTATPYALTTADLNSDRKVDIVVGYVEAPSAVYYNTGDGQHFREVRFGDDKGAVYGFAIADLDRDGVLDIAAARSDAPNVVYFGARAGTHNGSAR